MGMKGECLLVSDKKETVLREVTGSESRSVRKRYFVRDGCLYSTKRLEYCQ